MFNKKYYFTSLYIFYKCYSMMVHMTDVIIRYTADNFLIGYQLNICHTQCSSGRKYKKHVKLLNCTSQSLFISKIKLSNMVRFCKNKNSSHFCSFIRKIIRKSVNPFITYYFNNVYI